MKSINLFSKHMQWLNWDDMAKTAKNIGFDGLDLTVRPDGHISPENVENDLPKVIEICNKEGLNVEMICTNIQSISESFSERIIKTASQQGIKYYRMGWLFYDEEKSLATNLADIKFKLMDIEAVSRQYGIKACYQNHDGNWFGSPLWDLGKILGEINSEWLGCQYDILNASLEGINSWPLGLELLAPFIHTIDIKDGFWNFEHGKLNLNYAPLGKGMVNFEEFFSLINKFNIAAPLSVHFEYPLGGCETGARKLSAPDKDVVSAMKNDLQLLREYLK